MVAGNFAVIFESGQRGFDMIFVSEVAEKIEWAHSGRFMNNVEIAAHYNRTFEIFDDFSNFGKGLDGFFIANWIWTPETVMIHNRKAVFKFSNLQNSIIQNL